MMLRAGAEHGPPEKPVHPGKVSKALIGNMLHWESWNYFFVAFLNCSKRDEPTCPWPWL